MVVPHRREAMTAIRRMKRGQRIDTEDILKSIGLAVMASRRQVRRMSIWKSSSRSVGICRMCRTRRASLTPPSGWPTSSFQDHLALETRSVSQSSCIGQYWRRTRGAEPIATVISYAAR